MLHWTLFSLWSHTTREITLQGVSKNQSRFGTHQCPAIIYAVFLSRKRCQYSMTKKGDGTHSLTASKAENAQRLYIKIFKIGLLMSHIVIIQWK